MAAMPENMIDDECNITTTQKQPTKVPISEKHEGIIRSNLFPSTRLHKGYIKGLIGPTAASKALFLLSRNV